MFLSEPDSTTPFSRTLSSYAMASGWTDLGNMWIARGDTTMAVNSLRRALHWKGDHLNALLHIAALLRAVGHTGDACYVVRLIERKVGKRGREEERRGRQERQERKRSRRVERPNRQKEREAEPHYEDVCVCV